MSEFLRANFNCECFSGHEFVDAYFRTKCIKIHDCDDETFVVAACRSNGSCVNKAGFLDLNIGPDLKVRVLSNNSVY